MAKIGGDGEQAEAGWLLMPQPLNALGAQVAAQTKALDECQRELDECQREVNQLRWACINALILCDGCIGKIYADKVRSNLMKALREEADDA